MLDKKIPAYEKLVIMLPDKPNAAGGLTAADLKEWFDSAPEEIRVAFNSLIDELASSLGGAQIGFSATGFLSNNVSAAIVELLAIAQAAQAGTILPGTVSRTMLTTGVQSELDGLQEKTGPLTTVRLNKDANDIFTEIQYKRADTSLYMKSVLSGGTSPKYTTRTETFYAADGTTVVLTQVYTLSYTGDDLTSEVMS